MAFSGSLPQINFGVQVLEVITARSKKMQSFYFVLLAAVLCLYFCHVSAQSVSSSTNDDGAAIICLNVPKGTMDMADTVTKMIKSMM
ncbi:hypothetical protein TNCV_2398221 [Trichonephila clavipes]|uniref:Uncharacterized protein n=1 Tax=Trichonephila clavipes TaxID=2585209 RepID=A0A8X6T009_TRICX|nr:hypothetical protein TNCV_2398221 [Trichonephila clavipes]